MSENKRFTRINGVFYTDNETGWEFQSYGEVVALMNTLADENEQLKQQLEYIQNSISNHIKHQKTKLGQKALQKVIEDYNEWLLGHKRDLND